MARESAGILLYRRREGRVEVLLVHPGGPFWAKKDRHAWSIPKGEFEAGEDALEAARREFREETGFDPGEGPFAALAPCRQSGGKVIHAWTAEGDCDPAKIESNEFEMEWPPRSGQMQSFPEVDRAAWVPLDQAKEKVHKGQRPLIDQARTLLAAGDG